MNDDYNNNNNNNNNNNSNTFVSPFIEKPSNLELYIKNFFKSICFRCAININSTFYSHLIENDLRLEL